tara:strand:- start:16 stop:624 length:609 start_codon:yes stop_codon:yes gene_type:complete
MATYQDSRYNIALPSGAGGAIVPIKTLTASSSATLSFVDGSDDVVLDNTYRTYIFKFYNLHPSHSSYVDFTFQASTNTGSSYGVTSTSTWFTAYNLENATDAAIEYNAASDQAQGTAFEVICDNLGNLNDASAVGSLLLFNPSSTTFVKHYMSETTYMGNDPNTLNPRKAGYFNTTSAVDAIQFKMASGNIDAGTIKLYGIA